MKNSNRMPFDKCKVKERDLLRETLLPNGRDSKIYACEFILRTFWKKLSTDVTISSTKLIGIENSGFTPDPQNRTDPVRAQSSQNNRLTVWLLIVSITLGNIETGGIQRQIISSAHASRYSKHTASVKYPEVSQGDGEA